MGRKHLPADEWDAPVEDIADDQNQQRAGEEAAEVQHHPQALVVQLAPGGQGMRFHVRSVLLFPLDKDVEEHIDQHDEYKQHQTDRE